MAFDNENVLYVCVATGISVCVTVIAGAILAGSIIGGYQQTQQKLDCENSGGNVVITAQNITCIGQK